MVWSREERSFAIGLAVLALAGAGWLLAGHLAGGGAAADLPAEAGMPAAAGEELGAPAAGEAGEPGAAPAAAPAAEPPLVVHVAGAVRKPGVYRLPAGARVVDALAAAGGPADDAAVDAINLAAPIPDGSRLYVPSTAEVAAQGQPGDASWQALQAGTGGSSPAAEGSEAVAGPVRVNQAGPDELQRLPGIGPVLAERIVAYRQRNGPFTSVEDLLGVSGIGPKLLERIRPYVVVP